MLAISNFMFTYNLAPYLNLSTVAMGAAKIHSMHPSSFSLRCISLTARSWSLKNSWHAAKSMSASLANTFIVAGILIFQELLVVAVYVCSFMCSTSIATFICMIFVFVIFCSLSIKIEVTKYIKIDSMVLTESKHKQTSIKKLHVTAWLMTNDICNWFWHHHCLFTWAACASSSWPHGQ